jgi:amino acid adenylation domain-containing protein
MADNLTDIAIIGMAGRFPGAPDIGEFWRNLCEGRESIRFFTPEDLADEASLALAQQPGYVGARAIIDGVDEFDASFFGIYPREAELIDPQQRIFLECCWHAFEDAGYDPLSYRGVAGVYAGCSPNSYFLKHVCTDSNFNNKYSAGYQVSDFVTTLGTNSDFLATRVAYKLNLKGPAFTLNCGCSTSLVAISQACLSLQNYQVDMALAGGVSITFPQKRGYLYEPGGMVSPDGHCRTFDQDAQGTVFGDGAAVILLKRLEDALADEDHIYALIKGCGITNDGSIKVGFTAPGVEGQARAIAMAHAAAGVEPRSISYIEAHGTGTPLGDPIEIAALTQAFRRQTQESGFCAIGTAKTNIGHLDIAAGVTGVIKTALSLHHKLLPPTLHFRQPNPRLNLEDSPFYVNTSLRPWQRTDAPLRAGVSAFGIGGTNAHIVMEEAPDTPLLPTKRGSHLIVLSAKSEKALEAMTDDLATHCDAKPNHQIGDIAYTLMEGRHSFAERRYAVVHDSTDAATVLASRDPSRVITASCKAERPDVAFMFPGQGVQYVGMGRQLYAHDAGFRADMDDSMSILKSTAGLDLRSVIYPTSELESDQIDNTVYAQPAIFVVEYALARLWMRLGIRAGAMIGHSVGEFVAACLAGVFSLEQALRLISERGRLMQSLPTGAMLSIRLGEAQIASMLDDELSIAAVNGPALTVVAGPEIAIERLETRLRKEGNVFRRLRTSHAFHSSMMDPVREPFAEMVRSLTLSVPTIPFISTVSGTWISDAEAIDADYWAGHLREPVRFAKGIGELRSLGYALLEVGPGRTLSVLARQQQAKNQDQIVLSSMPEPAGKYTEEDSVLDVLGRLWLSGADPDWTAVYAGEKRRRVSISPYPFERKRCWIESPRTNTSPDADSLGSDHSEVTGCTDPTICELPTGNYDLQATESRPHGREAIGTENMELAQSLEREVQIHPPLLAIFQDLSGIDLSGAGGSTTFLELGFDSLFLTQVSQALQSKFGVKITFRQLLDQLSTLDALAAHLELHLAPQIIKDHGASSLTTQSQLSAVAQSLQNSESIEPISTPASTAVEALPATSLASLETILKHQLQTMTDLISKQLEVLGGVANGSSMHRTDTTPISPLATIASVITRPPPIHSAPTLANGPAPQPRKFVPFRPVETGSNGLDRRQQEHLRALVERYTRKTAGSKQFTERHRHRLADPRVAAGFRVEWKELIYPIVTNRSKGSKLWDVDGNEYIDMVNGYGPIMFGHAPEFVSEAIAAQLKRGYETGPQSPLAGEVADLICEMTDMDRVTFCNTGSEAVVAALRVARTVTARSKVVLFTGAYHGMFDEVVVKGLTGPNSPRSVPVAPGIPREHVENVVVLDYGTPEALSYIDAHAKELAAVLIEPVQSRHPGLRPVEFLQQIRRITEQSGTALIFDEVVTGFRVHPGGCQALLGIKADLATYGKVLAGGLPIGILAGRAAYMDALDGGQWNYGDDSYPEVGVTFFAGTFVRHPLALAAALAVLKHLKDAGPALQDRLAESTSRMAAEINAFLEARQLPTRVDSFGSFAHFIFPAELKYAGLFYYYMRERGIHIQEGFPMFLTTAHSDEDLARVVSAFRESIIEMQLASFLPTADATVISSSSQTPKSLEYANGRQLPDSPDKTVVDIADGTDAIEIPKVHGRAPVTESQLEILLSARISDEASCAYNESFTLRLTGKLEVAALEQALNFVISRHDALRASFSEDNQYQEFADSCVLNLRVEDLSALEKTAGCDRRAEIIDLEARTPFDLNRGPLVRAHLIKLEAQEHHLIFTTHHSVCDGWSTNIILEELSKSYCALRAGNACDLPPTMSFSAYAQIQMEHFSSSEGDSIENYWLEQFKRRAPLLDLPLDRSRPSVRSTEGATRRRHISKAVYQAIKRVGAQRKCTLFATLLASFHALLGRLSGQDDIVIGIPTAGQSLFENVTLVGHCVNFLPVRGNLTGDPSMGEFLVQIKRTLLDAYEHQNYTYGRLIRQLKIQRDPARLPLMEVQFNLERLGAAMNFSGLEVAVDPNPKTFVNQDLFLNVIESDDGLVLDCDYNTELFDASTIDRWLGHYETLLESIAADADRPLSRLPLLTKAEIKQLAVDWNDTRAEYPGKVCVHQLFEEQVRRTPEAIAVTFENQRITYSELNFRAARLANYLRTVGVAPGSLVGVFVERSVEMLVGLLGILKAGGAYVPMDPTYPAARIAFVLEEAKVAVLLSQKRLATLLPPSAARVVQLDGEWDTILHALDVSESNIPVCSQDLAYVIYTSGSTGKPKGVEIPHRAVVNLLCSMRKKPGIEPTDVLLAVTTLSFDIAALELFLPLCVGAKVVIASREAASDGNQLLGLLNTSAATLLQATPVTFRLLIEAGWSSTPQLKILCGGEALPRELANQLLERGDAVWNMYGPTETTIWSSACPVAAGDGRITIGGPIDNTQFHVLDAHQQLAPIGTVGELYIGGDGLARGYYNRPELTAEKFVHRSLGPGLEARLYRTGDMVRRLLDGSLEFLGRLDNQIKLRGFRIELAEIEDALLRHPQIRQAVVSVHEEVPGNKRLVAYLVSDQQALTVTAIREFLIGKLPDYMLPSAVVQLDEMPVTPNGKIDRTALPTPAATRATPTKEFTAPRTTQEVTMAGIWASVLHLERVGITDDLFELGADSLHIFQIAARANKEGIRIAPALFLKHRTIMNLLTQMDNSSQLKAEPVMPVIARVSREQYRIGRSSLQTEADRRNGSA